MASAPACRLHEHVRGLPDPRAEPAQRHALREIITIAICAVICGADTGVDVARYGARKAAWLRTFLALPHGIPSHDTVGRVCAGLDPVAVETAALSWVHDLVPTTGELIAIDGKTLRRSHDRARGQAALRVGDDEPPRARPGRHGRARQCAHRNPDVAGHPGAGGTH